MSCDADRTRSQLRGVRVLMRGERYRRPQSQQSTKTRYGPRNRPHDDYPATPGTCVSNLY